MTNEFTPGNPRYHEFAQHGDIRTHRHGRITTALVNGPVNLEAATMMVQTIRRLYAEVPEGTPFVQITEFRGSMLVTPDALAVLAGAIAETAATGHCPVLHIYAVDPDIEAYFMVRHAERAFAAAGRAWATVASMADAQALAEATLATLPAVPTS